ncbi:hypothetical protein CFC21_043609 [Triticum aestivum]|uniref:Uncharacterized protein n=3 Tax=Triticum TaxID=4564 RepID=A0A9R1JWQ3_WHEAT|nr:uncharacterized protein LOC119278198 [Triticum dicoccoides]XP_044345293.1 uncharacterized protein LOC123066234 [Triticum aestivum]KAF7032440.1 hypothetical protein CFC21_043609 [Triticum aestivum]CDM85795.1 unnamed protein product [Triticum aestivum]VAH83832.1 unnamed protein product [Triticum turgidum subsp. durum]
MEQTGGKGDHDSRLMRDLCTLLVTIIAPVAAASSVDSPRRPVARRPRGGMSPASAASMLLGASMALMLCGSVTFAIGFLLMPWVAGVALLFGFAGVISTLSSGLLPSSSPSSSKDKERRLLMPTQGRVRASAPMSSVPDKLVAWR